MIFRVSRFESATVFRVVFALASFSPVFDKSRYFRFVLWVKSKAADEHKLALSARIRVSRLVNPVTEILLDCVL